MAAAAAAATATPIEAVVIGSGVVGLAVARALAGGGGPPKNDHSPLSEVLIVDRAGMIGSGTSSRNSEGASLSLVITKL